MRTIPDILQKSGKVQKLSFYDSSLEISASVDFSGFRERVELASLYLVSRNIRKNDAIVLIVKHGTAFNILDFAIARTGAVSIPLSQNCPEGDLEFILGQINPKLVIAHELFARKHERILKEYETLVTDDALDFNFLETFQAGGREKGLLEAAEQSIDENDIFTVIYTSGSTGSPKGVMLSHKSVMHNVAHLAEGCFIPEGETVLSFLPLNHIFERVFSYIYLLQDVHVVYLQSADLLIPAAAEHKPYAFNASPVILQRILEAFIKTSQPDKRSMAKKFQHEPIDFLDFSAETDLTKADEITLRFRKFLGNHLNHICCGSSKMSSETARFFISCGIGVIEGYGMTEMSPIISYSRLKNVNKTGTVGKPLEGTDVRISEEGEILVKGPGQFLGYYKNEPLTDKNMLNGYIRTGDLGYFDDDNFLVVTSRISDVFKLSNGKFFYPAELEQRITELPYIEQAVIAGQNRNVPSVLAVLKPGRKYKFDELAGFEKEISCICASEKEGGLKFNSIFLPEPFTVGKGLLTPVLKMKRFAIEAKYSYLLDLLEKDPLITSLLYKLFPDDAEAELLRNIKDKNDLYAFVFDKASKSGLQISNAAIEKYFEAVETMPERKLDLREDPSALLNGNNNKCFNT